MKLYEAPRGAKVKLLGDNRNPPCSIPTEVGEIYKFHSIDGMYSYCTDNEGNVVHLVAWSEVEVVE